MKFRLLQASYAVSNLSDGIAIVAFPLLLVQSGGTVMQVGTLAAVSTLPGLLVSLPAGVFLDRSSARKVMVSTSIMRSLLCLIFIGLWWDLDGHRLIILLSLVVLLSCLEAVYDLAGPKVLTSIFTNIEELAAANSRLQIIETLGNRFIGASLAGVLITIGALSPIMIMVPLYLFAAGLIFMLRLEEPLAPVTHHRTKLDLGFVTGGLRFIFGSRVLLSLSFISLLANLGLAGCSAILVVFITQHLKAPLWSFGLLYACLALGGTAGAFLASGILRKLGMSRTIRITCIMLPPLIGLLALPVTPLIVGLQQFALGFVLTVCGISTSTYRQSVTPHEILGRVLSVGRIISYGSMPIGSILGAYLATKFGFGITFKILAVLLTLTWTQLSYISPNNLAFELKGR